MRRPPTGCLTVTHTDKFSQAVDLTYFSKDSNSAFSSKCDHGTNNPRNYSRIWELFPPQTPYIYAFFSEIKA